MAAGSIFRPIARPASKSVGTVADSRAAAAAAKAAQLQKFATRAKPDHAALQQKAEAQAVRDAERRIARDAAIAAIEQANRDAKAAALADTARISEEKAQFERDTAMFAAQAEADKIALIALRKTQRAERYAARAARAKTRR